MIEGLLSGILGGLFGPALATWMSRFKYWVVFSVATLATHVYSFVAVVNRKGLEKTIEIYFASGFDPVSIFAPMVIGVIAVVIAFVGSLNVPKEDSVNKCEDE
jgi:hypothetical protein